jgi:hypothetical protein
MAFVARSRRSWRSGSYPKIIIEVSCLRKEMSKKIASVECRWLLAGFCNYPAGPYRPTTSPAIPKFHDGSYSVCCWSQPSPSWPGLSRLSTPATLQKTGPTWGGRKQSFVGTKLSPLLRSRTFDAPNHVDSRDKPGHDALKLVRRSPHDLDSDDQQLTRQEPSRLIPGHRYQMSYVLMCQTWVLLT